MSLDWTCDRKDTWYQTRGSTVRCWTAYCGSVHVRCNTKSVEMRRTIWRNSNRSTLWALSFQNRYGRNLTVWSDGVRAGAKRLGRKARPNPSDGDTRPSQQVYVPRPYVNHNFHAHFLKGKNQGRYTTIHTSNKTVRTLYPRTRPCSSRTISLKAPRKTRPIYSYRYGRLSRAWHTIDVVRGHGARSKFVARFRLMGPTGTC